MYELRRVGPVVGGRGRVSLSRMSLAIWVYYVDGALIDTGPMKLAREFSTFVDALPGKVAWVGLTHLHEDHCGMASYFANGDVPIYCHWDYVESTSKSFRLPLYRRAFWGVPRPFTSKPFQNTVETERHRFHVHATPGHAQEHIVLHEPDEGWLFAGDVFIAPRIATAMRSECLPGLLTSLRRIQSLDFGTLFCAHAGPVVDGKDAVARRIQALEEVQDKVQRLAARGWSPGRVRRKLFPGIHPLTVLSLGEYSPGHVVRSFWPDR